MSCLARTRILGLALLFGSGVDFGCSSRPDSVLAESHALVNAELAPAQTALPSELQTLGRVRLGVWHDPANDYDPIALVRAVNELIPLGREEALRRLREYRELLGRDIVMDVGPLTDGPVGVDQADPYALVFIVRHLFAPRRGPGSPAASGFQMVRVGKLDGRFLELYTFDGVPTAQIGMISECSRASEQPCWRDYPFVDLNGLPLFAPRFLGGRTGYDVDPLAYVLWAEQYGEMRTTSLRPPDDPCAAIAALSDPEGAEERLILRTQVYQLLAPVLGLPALSGTAFENGQEVPDLWHKRVDRGNWEALRTRIAERGLHWDLDRQQYAPGSRGR
jgi:hypothetical protein